MKTYMNMKHILLPLLFCLSLCFAACNRGGESSSSGERKLFPIVNNPEHPNIVFLSITEKTEQDTSILYTIKGLHGQDTVGFLMTMDKLIPAGVNKDGSVNVKDGFRTGNIRFDRSGPESDYFVVALSKLWAGASEGNFSENPVLPLVFSSNKDAIDHNKSTTYSFKLFFDPDADKPGEVFFTFDTYKQAIQFQEKDPAFRQTIIDAFSGKITGKPEGE